MRKFIPIGLVLVVLWAAMIYAAAPTFTGAAMKVADTCTINIQHTASKWKAVNTTPLIYTMTDSCYITATVSGYVELDPGDKLYIGLREVSAGNDSVVADTFIFSADENQHGKVYMPFTIMYVDSLLSQTDDVDSIFVNAACGGTGSGESVVLKNVYGDVVVQDRD